MEATTPAGPRRRWGAGAVLALAFVLTTVPLVGSVGEHASLASAPEPVSQAHPEGHAHGSESPTDGPVSPRARLSMVTASQAPGGDPTRAVPQVAEGFFLQPLAAVGFPTAITFGPGGADGPDLYATVLPSQETAPGNAFAGRVVRVHLLWTPAGPSPVSAETTVTGFQRPLGLAFDDGDLYVSDVHPNPATGRDDGRITKLDPSSDTTQSDGEVILDGLPTGRHHTNHIRFFNETTLLIPNGNPNDAGCTRNQSGGFDCDGGTADVYPISGAVLAVNVSELSETPAVLDWTDGSGTEISPYRVWGHKVNQDFRAKVSVVASGFRNIFGVTDAPQDLAFGGHLYTAMNGADSPGSQDALFKLPKPGSTATGRNFTFPYCFNVGPAGGVGDDVSTSPNPMLSQHPAADCQGVPKATALLGWHTCTTGLDFPREAKTTGQVPDASFPERFAKSLFVSECATFFADDWLVQSSQDPTNVTHSTSHKVVRVLLDDDGEATRVQDFVTGLAAPTDVQFGPDGAMYVADATGIHRIAPVGDLGNPLLPGPAQESTSGVTIQTAGVQFAPQVVVVPKGTTTTWTGNLVFHTVTTSDGFCVQDLLTPDRCRSNDDADPHTFDEGLFPGETVSHTWQAEGVHEYFCEEHDFAAMTGAIVVTPSP